MATGSQSDGQGNLSVHWRKLGIFVYVPGGRWLEKIALDCRLVLRYQLVEERFFVRIDVLVPEACPIHEVLIMTFDFVEDGDGLIPAEPRQEVFFAVRPTTASGISAADLEEYFRMSSGWFPSTRASRGLTEVDVVSFHQNMVLNLRTGNQWTVRRFAAGASFGDLAGQGLAGASNDGVESERASGSGSLQDISIPSAAAGVVRRGGSVETFLRGTIFDFDAVVDFEFSSIDLVPVPLSIDRYGVHFKDLGWPVDFSIGASPDRIRFFGNPTSAWIIDLVTAGSASSRAYHDQIRRHLQELETATGDCFGASEEELCEHARLCTYVDHFLEHCDLRREQSPAIEVCCSRVRALHDRWSQRALETCAQLYSAQIVPRRGETGNLRRSDSAVSPDVDPCGEIQLAAVGERGSP